MQGMFSDASAFNGNISSWDTSALTDISYMFGNATSFNQNLCAWKDQFPYNNANEIFVDSGCTFQDNPQIETQGPFCASDCTNG
jgi:surface protein